MRFPPRPTGIYLQRFRALSRKVNDLLDSGRFAELDPYQQSRLVQRLQLLYRQLVRVFSRRQLRQTLAGAALLLGMGTAQAQQFAPPLVNPFGLESSQVEDEFLISQLVDIDNDGDFDLIHRTYVETSNYENDLVIVFQENMGTGQAPQFGPLEASPFGVDTLPEGTTTLTFGDLDGDGDLDILSGVYDDYGSAVRFRYQENIGSPTNALFGAPVDNPFGLNVMGDEVTVPYLVDLDNDGDLDLLASQYNNDTEQLRFVYYPNIGSVANAQFGAPQENPFGLEVPSDAYIQLLTLADFDNDGDLDILTGGSYEDLGSYNYQPGLDYYENTGTAENPAFDSPQRNPFGLELPVGGYVAVPTAADLDNDGDTDVLVGGYDQVSMYETAFTFRYFENTLLTSNDDLPATETQFSIYPTVSTGLVNWSWEGDETPTSAVLRVFSADGRPVRKFQVSGGGWSIGARGLTLRPVSGSVQRSAGSGPGNPSGHLALAYTLQQSLGCLMG